MDRLQLQPGDKLRLAPIGTWAGHGMLHAYVSVVRGQEQQDAAAGEDQEGEDAGGGPEEVEDAEGGPEEGEGPAPRRRAAQEGRRCLQCGSATCNGRSWHTCSETGKRWVCDPYFYDKRKELDRQARLKAKQPSKHARQRARGAARPGAPDLVQGSPAEPPAAPRAGSRPRSERRAAAGSGRPRRRRLRPAATAGTAARAASRSVWSPTGPAAPLLQHLQTARRAPVPRKGASCVAAAVPAVAARRLLPPPTAPAAPTAAPLRVAASCCRSATTATRWARQRACRSRKGGIRAAMCVLL